MCSACIIQASKIIALDPNDDIRLPRRQIPISGTLCFDLTVMSDRRASVSVPLFRFTHAHTDDTRSVRRRSRMQGCIAWIANAEDLPRLGAELLKYDAADPFGYRKASLPYQLDKQFGERSYPYLRRAMGESRQLWVRKEAALPLARRGEPDAVATLLDI